MEYNMEGTTVRGIGYPVPVDEKSRLPSTVSKQPQASSAECQAEEHGHTTGISVYEYEYKTPNEKLLWIVLRQAEIKTKTL